MRCACKLKEKLKEAEKQKYKYDKKCQRISKMIANREGKKLRLVIWEYEEETTMYVTYSAYPTMQYNSNSNLGFFDKGNLGLIPWSSNIGETQRIWERDGAKISHDIVTYYGKQYRLNKKAQLCEVTSKGLFKKVSTEVVICDLIK